MTTAIPFLLQLCNIVIPGLPRDLMIIRAALLALLLSLLTPHQALALSKYDWRDLWWTPDQQGKHLLEQDKAEEASDKFVNPDWAATAAYRAGNYDKAAQLWQSLETADSHYNLGNALALQSNIEDAIQAYEHALSLEPEHHDAQLNLELMRNVKEMQEANEAKKKQQENENSQKAAANQPPPASQPPAEQQALPQDNDNQTSLSQATSEGSPASRPHEPTELSQSALEQANQSQPPAQLSDARDDSEDKTPLFRRTPQDSPTQHEEREAPLDSQDSAHKDPQAEYKQQAMTQWLRRIENDPGELLRRKFLLERARKQRDTR